MGIFNNFNTYFFIIISQMLATNSKEISRNLGNIWFPVQLWETLWPSLCLFHQCNLIAVFITDLRWWQHHVSQMIVASSHMLMHGLWVCVIFWLVKHPKTKRRRKSNVADLVKWTPGYKSLLIVLGPIYYIVYWVYCILCVSVCKSKPLMCFHNSYL